MSSQFPDRSQWLAIRHTPANLWRTLGRVVVTDTTLCVGRNAQKRAMGKGRQRVKTRKAAQRIQREAAAAGARPVRPHRSGGHR